MESLDSRLVRRSQLESIHAHLKDYSHKLFCGDFNFDDTRNFDISDTKPLENTWMIENFKGYIDIWSELHPNEKGDTFDTTKNKMLSGHREERMRYDRIMLSSKKWTPKDIQIFGDEPMPNQASVHISDHFGLVSCIEWKE